VNCFDLIASQRAAVPLAREQAHALLDLAKSLRRKPAGGGRYANQYIVVANSKGRWETETKRSPDAGFWPASPYYPIWPAGVADRSAVRDNEAALRRAAVCRWRQAIADGLAAARAAKAQQPGDALSLEEAA
jgi:hypothetical protein